jgi:hypothetical protein
MAVLRSHFRGIGEKAADLHPSGAFILIQSIILPESALPRALERRFCALKFLLPVDPKTSD